MAIKEWTTTFIGINPIQDTDPVTTDQPDLVNEEDLTRVSQIHTVRDKVDSLARIVGDSNNDPGTSLKYRVNSLETSVSNLATSGVVFQQVLASGIMGKMASIGPESTTGSEVGLIFDPLITLSNSGLLFAFRNGMLMKPVSALTTDRQEYVLTSSGISFLAETTSGSWYHMQYLSLNI